MMIARKIEIAAVLFADIANSTHIYEVLGDKEARAFLGECISILAGIACGKGGTVIKTIGDEIMLSFPTADGAVEAAIAMHQEMGAVRFEGKKPISVLNIRIGFNFGQVIRENGDVFGDAVNVAARMAALAKQRQIITTEQTLSCLKPEFRNSARLVDKTTIKGKSGEIDIFEIVWEHKAVTMVLGDRDQHRAVGKTRMELHIGEKIVEVDEAHPFITLGRQIHNDLVIDDKRVSRSHARIEYRRGKFVLIDQSTNGTYVQAEGEETKHLIYDEMVLDGQGVISLGHKITSDSPEEIRYSIKNWNCCS